MHLRVFFCYSVRNFTNLAENLARYSRKTRTKMLLGTILTFWFELYLQEIAILEFSDSQTKSNIKIVQHFRRHFSTTQPNFQLH